MKILHFILLKSVCHKIVLVKGVERMLTKDDEGGRGGKPKGDEGWQWGGGPGNPLNWLT